MFKMDFMANKFLAVMRSVLLDWLALAADVGEVVAETEARPPDCGFICRAGPMATTWIWRSDESSMGGSDLEPPGPRAFEPDFG